MIFRLLDRTIERVVVKPRSVLIDELLELLAEPDIRLSAKSLERQCEDSVLPFIDRAVIDFVGHEVRSTCDLICRDQSVVDKFLGRDRKRIAGKCREALVRRVAISRGSERQD